MIKVDKKEKLSLALKKKFKKKENYFKKNEKKINK